MQTRHVCAPVQPDRSFQVPDLYWRSPECGDLRHTARQWKEIILSHSEISARAASPCVRPCGRVEIFTAPFASHSQSHNLAVCFLSQILERAKAHEADSHVGGATSSSNWYKSGECNRTRSTSAIHQPSEEDQIDFFRSLIDTGARRNPASCVTKQGNVKNRFNPALRAGGYIGRSQRGSRLSQMLEAFPVPWIPTWGVRLPAFPGTNRRDRTCREAPQRFWGGSRRGSTSPEALEEYLAQNKPPHPSNLQ